MENQGSAGAGYFVVTINNATTTVEGLPALAITQAGVPFAHGPVGQVIAFADSSHLVEEIFEGNNTNQIKFTAPPPCPTSTP